jgi:Flp pilus assembly protein TadG
MPRNHDRIAPRTYASLPAALWHDRHGGVLVFVGMMLPVMLLLVGSAINLGLMMNYDTKLQTATDAAALSVAKELQLANETTDEARAVGLAKALIAERLGVKPDNLAVEAKLDEREGTVEIAVQQRVSGFILGSMLTPPDTLSSSAAARVVGKVPVCVVGLDDAGAGAIWLARNARMTGNNCAVYSNSSNPGGLKSMDNAVLHSALTCSAGGFEGSRGNYDPTPLSDCPVFEDPLADRPAPAVAACDPGKPGSGPSQGKSGSKGNSAQVGGLMLDSGDYTLDPGTYCGGIHILGTARVKLNPGTYVIKDGPLEVADQGALDGEHTSFYLTGFGAVFKFSADTTVSLGASADGTLAGLLFFEDRANPLGQQHEIFSNNTHNLLGTIYLPRGTLYIGADAPIADESAYTAIVAHRLQLEAGPNLVLNTDYAKTDVPVPDAIYGSGSRILLTR